MGMEVSLKIRGILTALILGVSCCQQPAFADERSADETPSVILQQLAAISDDTAPAAAFVEVAGSEEGRAVAPDTQSAASQPADVAAVSPVKTVSASSEYSLEQRIAHLESLVGQLQYRNQNHLIEDLHTQQDREAYGDVYFATEVSFLRPYLSGARSSSTSTGGKWIDPSYGTATRFMLGLRDETGLGLQLRYTGFNHGADLANVFGGGGFGVKLDSLEAEVTLRERFRRWDLDLGAGIRWGQFAITGDGVVTFPGRLTYKGIGPTFSVNGRRQLGSSPFSLLANFRGGLLLGEIHNTHPARGLAIGGVEDEIAFALENQLGLAWSRPVFNDSMMMEVRAVWETQFWLNETISDDVYGIGTNLGLSGPSVALELRY